MSIKILVKSFGCQMNVRDSEVICGLLPKQDYTITEDETEADIVIFNTCSVRKHAEDKVWSEIGRIAKVVPPKFADANLSRGDTRPMKKIIGLVGCMAQNYKENIFTRCQNVDFIAGPRDIDKIPRILDEFLKSKAGYITLGKKKQKINLFEKKIYETDGEFRPEAMYHSGFRQDKKHAYIVISEGCSNFCSYCVVPYVRGGLQHRTYWDILQEIEATIDKGIRKITLLGQNVNAYRDGDIDFVKLIGLINAVDDLEEFSFITSHPKDASMALFKAMADADKLKKYLHLPVQSGSDRILALMNRGYTGKSYLELVAQYRNAVSGGALTTDVIVGFPTETESDFQETYSLVQELQFDSAFIFKYSSRPHTEAEKMPDDVRAEEKKRRHHLILELQKEISRKRKVESEKRRGESEKLKFRTQST